MKTLITTLIALAITLNLNAQCKLKIDTDNQKETKREWFQSDMAGGHGLFLGKTGDKYTMRCHKSIVGITSLYASKGDKLSLTLENGETLVFENTTPAKTTVIQGGGSASFVVTHYNITKEELEKLAASKIVKFRFETKENFQEGKANKKKGCERIMTNAACVLAL